MRNVCGEHVIVAHGLENVDFSKIISLNDTAAYLWNALLERDFTEEEMADILTEGYEVDAETALADSCNMAAQWKEIGLIE